MSVQGAYLKTRDLVTETYSDESRILQEVAYLFMGYQPVVEYIDPILGKEICELSILILERSKELNEICINRYKESIEFRAVLNPQPDTTK